MFLYPYVNPSVTRRMLGVCAAAVTLMGNAHAATAQKPLGSSVFPVDSARSRKTSEASSQRSIVDTVTATLSKLEMHETTVPAGGAPHAPHRHVDEEMIVVRSGTIETLMGTEKRTIGPGGVAFFASNQLHGLRNPGTTPATYFVIRIYPHDLPREPGR
jgi:XRE family transcriptional regulator, regulator of sulfur utilization